MEKLKKGFLTLLALILLCSFDYMQDVIYATNVSKSLLEANFEETLNETQSEADIKMNLTYDTAKVNVNKIVHPDKEEIGKKEEALLSTTYHVIENKTYDFEVFYTNIETLEEKQETFSYEMKILKIEEEVKPIDTKLLGKETLEIEEEKTENIEELEKGTPTPPVEEIKEEVKVTEVETEATPPLQEEVEAEKTQKETNSIVERSTRQETPITFTSKGIVFWNADTKTKLNPQVYSANWYWEGSILYWGVSDWRTWGLGYHPMKWRILNTNEKGYGQDGGLLIMTANSGEISLAQSYAFNNAFNNPNYKGATYEGSSLDTFINNKFTSYLSDQEKGMTLESSANETYMSGVSTSGYEFSDKFSNKIWFAPTVKMMTNRSFGYPSAGYNHGTPSASGNKTREMGFSWWLSTEKLNSATPLAMNDHGAIYARSSLELLQSLVAASQLNPNSILFVSNAVGEKKTTDIGPNALTPVATIGSGEYKLTIKDTTQKLTVNSAIADASNLVTINYSKTGPGTTLSAIVTDKDGNDIISYGQLASIADTDLTNATATVQLPANFFSNEYKLKVFTEIYNGDKRTDYASAIVDTDVREYQAPTYTSKGLVFWDDDTKAKLNPQIYSGNQAWKGSKLYWGTNGTAPMKWRILNTDETGFGQSSGVLIMHDYTGQIGTKNYHHTLDNVYNTSDLATYIDEKYSTLLNDKEQGATLESNRSEINYTAPFLTWTDIITNKKWFAPTMRMMITEAYGYPNKNIQNIPRQLGSNFRVSSAWYGTTHSAGFIGGLGHLGEYGATSVDYVVAATRLNPNSILLVSNAVDGKKTTDIGPNALTPVATIGSGEYKMTLKDTTQTLTVNSAKCNVSNLVTINYSKTGPGTTLSAIVTDKEGNNIIFYGQLASIASTDLTNETATVQLPENFFTNEYKLKLFTEIAKGDKKTDYASVIVEVTPTIHTYTVTYNSNNGTTVEEQTYLDGEKITKPSDPTRNGYTFAGWYKDDLNTLWKFDTDKVVGDMTLQAKWYEIFTLSFSANTGTGTMSDVKFIETDSVTLSSNTFTKINFSFAGWNT